MKRLFAGVLGLALCAACNTGTKQFVGTITDATMNAVTVTADGVSVLFPIENADLNQANGLLLGAPAVVEYKGRPDRVRRVLKVSTDATYANAVGEWTMPDPSNDGSVMGLQLMVNGEAESVNMETLKYTSWELLGDDWKIRLRGQSFGNGVTLDVVEEATIVRDDRGWRLEVEGGPTYTKSL